MADILRRQALQRIVATSAGISLLSGCLSSETGTDQGEPTESTKQNSVDSSQPTVSIQTAEVGERVPIATGEQLRLAQVRARPEVLCGTETGEKRIVGDGKEIFILLDFQSDSEIAFGELIEYLQVPEGRKDLTLLEKPVISAQEFETVGVRLSRISDVQTVHIDWKDAGEVHYRWDISGSRLEDLLAVPRFEKVELKFPVSVEQNSQVSFDVQAMNSGVDGEFVGSGESLDGVDFDRQN